MGDGELEVLEGEAQDVVQPLLAITRKSRSHTDVHSAKSRRVGHPRVLHRLIQFLILQSDEISFGSLITAPGNQSVNFYSASIIMPEVSV